MTDEPAAQVWLPAHVNVSNAAQLVAAARGNRRRITVVNYQTVTVYLGADATITALATNTLALASGASVTIEAVAAIYGVTAATYTAASEDTKVHVWEEYA